MLALRILNHVICVQIKLGPLRRTTHVGAHSTTAETVKVMCEHSKGTAEI